MTSIGERGVLLYGGETAPPPNGGEVLSDTWIFTANGGWARSGAESPGVWGNDVVFDEQSNRVIMLGNLRGFAEVTPQTWAFDPVSDTWTQMAPEQSPAHGEVAYDAESDRVILFGKGETWSYNYEADEWMRMAPETSPTRREWHRLTYDAESDRVILFGGTNDVDPTFGDTWAYDFNTGSWREVSPSTSPSARFYFDVARDPVRGRAILFGGADGPFEQEVPFDDTWALEKGADEWVALEPSGPPGARGWHAMAHDESTGLTVLFGGGSARDEFTQETWLYDPDANTWTEATF